MAIRSAKLITIMVLGLNAGGAYAAQDCAAQHAGAKRPPETGMTSVAQLQKPIL